jgi:hypothetical protein
MTHNTTAYDVMVISSIFQLKLSFFGLRIKHCQVKTIPTALKLQHHSKWRSGAVGDHLESFITLWYIYNGVLNGWRNSGSFLVAVTYHEIIQQGGTRGIL